jgi:hypothetical protein
VSRTFLLKLQKNFISTDNKGVKWINSVYFAGALFNHKDLVGNLILCERIFTVSQGKYKCLLPQNLEVSEHRGEQIRNNDITGPSSFQGELYLRDLMTFKLEI